MRAKEVVPGKTWILGLDGEPALVLDVWREPAPWAIRLVVDGEHRTRPMHEDQLVAECEAPEWWLEARARDAVWAEERQTRGSAA